MRKMPIFVILAVIFFVFNAPAVLAEETFSFFEDFNFSRNINTKTTSAKIDDGKVFVSDDSISSKVESLNVATTLFDFNRVGVGANHFVPAGARIIYFVSTNGGKIWNQVEPNGFLYNMPAGRELRWAAVLARPAIDSPSPFMDAVRITFARDGYDNKSDLVFNSGSLPNFLDEFYNNLDFGLGMILGASNKDAKSSKDKISANTANSGADKNDAVSVKKSDDTFVLPKSRLLRARDADKIYYITEKGLKRHVPNSGVFLSYNNKWSEVADVSWGALDRYPDNKYIFWEKTNPHKKVYKLDGDKKYFIPDSELKRLGLKDHEIAPVNKTEFDYYKFGL